MKRAHRTYHHFIWLVLGPLIAAILLVALFHRPPTPDNETLPDTLIQSEVN